MNGRDDVASRITDALVASIEETGPLCPAGLSPEMWTVTGNLEDGGRGWPES